ncbi:CHAT domain-containing protein [Sphaerothrix gracilis]|uniref:CHAT domain-containing protein n=1 Tax=Sphaerothrix gracilis TaxID=3151835 RepID=UPI0031FCA4CB
MSQPEKSQPENVFHISGSSIQNLSGSGSIYYAEAASSNQPNSDSVSDTSSHLPIQKILILSANPQNTSQRRLAEEVRDIHEGLQRSQKRDQFVLEQRWAVRPRDIQRSLLEVRPQVVHFCGHSQQSASIPESPLASARSVAVVTDIPEPEGLVFEDNQGQMTLVEAQALAGLFALFADQIECVLLNACYSQGQAEAIAQQIPYVIGLSQALGDRAAIEFAVSFYDALGAGESIEFAYQFGCAAVQLWGVAKKQLPVLNKRT